MDPKSSWVVWVFTEAGIGRAPPLPKLLEESQLFTAGAATQAVESLISGTGLPSVVIGVRSRLAAFYGLIPFAGSIGPQRGGRCCGATECRCIVAIVVEIFANTGIVGGI
jgi:hypothetical protein